MRQQGLTLIELMISMVLGLILTAGVMTLFVQSQQSYSATREIAIMDQNAQVLMDLVEHDLQRVGYAFGCRPDRAANLVNITQVNENNGAPLPSIVDGTKLQGFSKDASDEAASVVLKGVSLATYNSIKTDTDYFMMMVGDPSKQGRVQTRTNGGGGANFKAVFEKDMPNLRGQVIYMATPDCDQVSQFTQVNNTPVGARTVTNITHSQGGGTGTQVKNCENRIVGSNLYCGDPNSNLLNQDFPAGGTIMVVEYLGYALNRNNELLRINALATDGSEASALLSGVSDFQIEYGFATSASSIQNGVRSVNVYATAQEVEDASLAWSDLVSLRLDFALQSDLRVNGQPFEKRYSRLMTLRNEVID